MSVETFKWPEYPRLGAKTPVGDIRVFSGTPEQWQQQRLQEVEAYLEELARAYAENARALGMPVVRAISERGQASVPVFRLIEDRNISGDYIAGVITLGKPDMSGNDGRTFGVISRLPPSTHHVYSLAVHADPQAKGGLVYLERRWDDPDELTPDTPYLVSEQPVRDDALFEPSTPHAAETLCRYTEARLQEEFHKLDRRRLAEAARTGGVLIRPEDYYRTVALSTD